MIEPKHLPALVGITSDLRDYADRLAETGDAMRDLLQTIWDLEEMGWITSSLSPMIECGVCPGKGATTDDVAHEEWCLQGKIYRAMAVWQQARSARQFNAEGAAQ